MGYTQRAKRSWFWSAVAAGLCIVIGILGFMVYPLLGITCLAAGIGYFFHDGDPHMTTGEAVHNAGDWRFSYQRDPWSDLYRPE
jgi:hypothetical protein